MESVASRIVAEIAILSPADRAMVRRLLSGEAVDEGASRELRTGLLNNDGFVAVATATLEGIDVHERQLVRIGVHRLESIRSAKGVAIADDALRCVADVLRGGFRGSDVVGLLDDDTFVVLCGSTPHQALAKRIAGSVDGVAHGLPVRVAVSLASKRATTAPVREQIAELDGALQRAMVDDVYRAAGLSASIAR